MAKDKRFTFLCDSEERRILAALAERLQCSQSDVVRWLIREAAAELKADETKVAQAESEPAEIASGFWILSADFWLRWVAVSSMQKYFLGGHMSIKKKNNESVEGATVQYINTGGGPNIQTYTFIGRDQNITVGPSLEEVTRLFTALNAAIDTRPKTDAETKAYLKAEVKELQMHVEGKGETSDEGFIDRHLCNISRMAPDILDVVIATLGNPAGGLMLAIKKSAEKAKELAGKS